MSGLLERSSDLSPGSRWRRGAAGLIFLALLLAMWAFRRRWIFTCDDAYISFRYAANLVEYGALTFDTGHVPPVEGYTNFAWVVLVAAGMWLGVPPEPWTGALGLAAGGLILWCIVSWAARSSQGPGARAGGAVVLGSPGWWIGCAVAGALAMSPAFLVWTSSGLETSLSTAAVVGCATLAARGRDRAAGALAALSILTRPDAVVPLGGMLVGSLLATADPRALLRRCARAAAWCVVPVALHLAWRQAYYGAWLPHTWAVKRHGVGLAGAHGRAYLTVWLRDLPIAALLPALLLARRRHLPLVFGVAATWAYVVSVGGDFMAYGRFLHGSLALLAMLLGQLWTEFTVDAGHLADPATRRHLRVRARTILTVAAMGIVVGLAWRGGAMALERDRARSWLDDRFESVAAMDRFARVRVAAGRWMRVNLPPDAVVSVGAAGAMPFASGLSVIDTYGLVEPDLEGFGTPDLGPKARPGHQLRAPLEYVVGRDPDLMCHLGHVGPRAPSTREARRRGQGDYRWACVPVGVIELPLESPSSQDVGTYCCLRRADHTVGPFSGGRP